MTHLIVGQILEALQGQQGSLRENESTPLERGRGHQVSAPFGTVGASVQRGSAASWGESGKNIYARDDTRG